MKLIIINTILIALSQFQIYPNQSSQRNVFGKTPADPFAAPTGVTGDPFKEDNPLTVNPDQDNREDRKSNYVDLLPEEKKRAIVTIEGDKTAGTGFIAKINDILFVVTNVHVIKNIKKPKFMTLGGEKISPASIFAAIDFDVAILRMTDQNWPYYFEVTDEILKDAKVGTEVIIPGNILGDGTILQTKGSIVAVGPKLIEHDAPTFSGNSGSPILKIDDWKVLGVDTLSKKRDLLQWFNQHSKTQAGSQVKNDVRLFGYRMDNIKDWEKISFSNLPRQNEELSTIQIEALSVLSAVWGTDWHYQRSDTVSRIINRYLERTSRRNLSTQDVEFQKKTARSLLYNHIVSMKKRAVEKQMDSYELMKNDYSETILLCDKIIEYVGRYYQSDSTYDPFEAR